MHKHSDHEEADRQEEFYHVKVGFMCCLVNFFFNLLTRFLLGRLLQRLRHLVHQALEKVFEKPGSRKVIVLGPNRRKMKLVDIDQKEAYRLEKLERVNISFKCCPIKKKTMAIRCHRCLGYS